jgi:hypothetical protein
MQRVVEFLVTVDPNPGSDYKVIQAREGSHPLYFAYKKSESSGTPVTDVTLLEAVGDDIEAPHKYTKLSRDLDPANERFVYACIRQANDGDVITDFKVIKGSSPDVKPESPWKRIPVDLRTGAGGDYIFLCYNRS